MQSLWLGVGHWKIDHSAPKSMQKVSQVQDRTFKLRWTIPTRQAAPSIVLASTHNVWHRSSKDEFNGKANRKSLQRDQSAVAFCGKRRGEIKQNEHVKQKFTVERRTVVRDRANCQQEKRLHRIEVRSRNGSGELTTKRVPAEVKVDVPRHVKVNLLQKEGHSHAYLHQN